MNAVMNLGRLLRLKIKVTRNVLDTSHCCGVFLSPSVVSHDTPTHDTLYD